MKVGELFLKTLAQQPVFVFSRGNGEFRNGRPWAASTNGLATPRSGPGVSISRPTVPTSSMISSEQHALSGASANDFAGRGLVDGRRTPESVSRAASSDAPFWPPPAAAPGRRCAVLVGRFQLLEVRVSSGVLADDRDQRRRRIPRSAVLVATIRVVKHELFGSYRDQAVHADESFVVSVGMLRERAGGGVEGPLLGSTMEVNEQPTIAASSRYA